MKMSASSEDPRVKVNVRGEVFIEGLTLKFFYGRLFKKEIFSVQKCRSSTIMYSVQKVR